MNENELKLLEIAKEIIELNSNNMTLALTGSLMLKLRGIETRRDVKDIDLISNEGLWVQGPFYPILPKSFKQSNIDGLKSQVDAIQFTEKENGIKVDVMHSDEEFDIIDGIPCGTVYELLYAKACYMIHDKSDESSEKHQLDIEYLRGKVSIDIDEIIAKAKESLTIFIPQILIK